MTWFGGGRYRLRLIVWKTFDIAWFKNEAEVLAGFKSRLALFERSNFFAFEVFMEFLVSKVVCCGKFVVPVVGLHFECPMPFLLTVIIFDADPFPAFVFMNVPSIL